MLQAEFDVAPGEETNTLHQRVQSGLIERGEALFNGQKQATMPSAGKPSVAILPFDVMTEEPDLHAFSDGLTKEVVASLSRIKAVRVVVRNTMFPDKGRPIDIRSIGRELDARYILEGSVRRSGTRIRVSAQLIEAKTGHHIWAGRVDRAGSDIFELQDDITSGIVASVQTQLF